MLGSWTIYLGLKFQTYLKRFGRRGMQQSESGLSSHTNSVERVFLESKSKEELVQIILEFQEKLSYAGRS